jgi:hypothetical protein
VFVCTHFLEECNVVELPPGQYTIGRWQHLFSSHLLFFHARHVLGQEEIRKSDRHMTKNVSSKNSAGLQDIVRASVRFKNRHL